MQCINACSQSCLRLSNKYGTLTWLTLSPPIPLMLYTLPQWSNPLIFDITMLWRSRLTARAPECQKIKNSGLDQYGAELFEQQQFGPDGDEGIKRNYM